ncbi:MAG: HlyC/CorC family transporter [Desulfobacteraceae bacterium]|nr:HlyC/CorC family transporter [Desulfobacteraceae bacterium]
MLNQLILLLVLLILSGFFSSAETALFSISRTKARHLAKEKGRSFALISRMKEDPHRLLSTILIGNNVVNVAAASLATALAISAFPNYAVGAATAIMTLLILVFGEVFPKSIATRNNVMIAKLTIIPIFWLSRILMPLIWFLNFIPKIAGKIKKTHSVTEAELMTFVEVVEEQGEIKEEEKELIHNVFEFDDTKASEIMTPRADMFVIDSNEELDLKHVAESGYTRIPVIDGDIDHVVGILNVKDLIPIQAAANGAIDVRKIMRKPYFVPENKKLDSLLKQFKKRKNHIAIVVDEHGGISGLITLEDSLEELVGEIRDETDKEEPHIIKRKTMEWLVLGKSDIEEVNEIINMEIPESPEYDTFSGFILDRIGRIPSENEEIDIGSFRITVKEMDGNRIKKYIVRKTHDKAPSSSEKQEQAS